MKGTAIFGGVQVFNILIGLAKSKVAAVFLGTDGVGIFGLFTSVLELIRNITGLGLNISGVREISYHAANEVELTRTVNIVRRLCWLTGVLGMVSMLVLAPWLSQWTFNNSDYTVSFMILSTVPLLQALSFGQLAVLQGMRRLQQLAKSNLYGGLIGLLFLVPLYWWLGVQGIVPLIVISAAGTLCFSHYFANKLKIEHIVLTFRQTRTMGMAMIKLGVLLTLSAFLASLINYGIRIFITNVGSLTDVGLFTAGTTIVVSYIGLVFSAMGADFFPRLSAARDDNAKMGEMANQQAEIGVLLLTPMIIVFMVFAPFILELLYSSSFIPVAPMLRWMMLGVLLQASSWPLAFVILAKANNKMYMFKEVGYCIYLLIFSLLGYHFYGITGLGMGYVATYVCSLIQNVIINKVLYNITLNRDYFKVLIPNILFTTMMFAIVVCLDNTFWLYLLGGAILAVSITFSYCTLDKRIGIKELVKTKFKKQ